ncbi:MAG TPA: hypothetical protein VIZ31_05860 [Vicinamibacteria bacterium]
MSRRQRPPRRLATTRAARRRRLSFVPPERLPATSGHEELDGDAPSVLDYDDLRDLSFDWEAD